MGTIVLATTISCGFSKKKNIYIYICISRQKKKKKLFRVKQQATENKKRGIM